MEESCSRCLQKCSPSASLAWLMSHSTESFQARDLHQGAVQTGLCAQQAQPMLEGKADTQLTTSPPLLILSCENPRNSPHSPASGQDHEDGHGITSNGQMGMASVGMACNTNPLFEVPVTPDPQEGPALGLSSPLAQVGLSCPQQGPALQGGCLGQASQQCQLCTVLPVPHRVSCPSKQEAAPSWPERMWGRTREAVLQGLMLLLSQPSTGTHRGLTGHWDPHSTLTSLQGHF